jgi:hypothetical protein
MQSADIMLEREGELQMSANACNMDMVGPYTMVVMDARENNR